MMNGGYRDPGEHDGHRGTGVQHIGEILPLVLERLGLETQAAPRTEPVGLGCDGAGEVRELVEMV